MDHIRGQGEIETLLTSQRISKRGAGQLEPQLVNLFNSAKGLNNKERSGAASSNLTVFS